MRTKNRFRAWDWSLRAGLLVRAAIGPQNKCCSLRARGQRTCRVLKSSKPSTCHALGIFIVLPLARTTTAALPGPAVKASLPSTGTKGCQAKYPDGSQQLLCASMAAYRLLTWPLIIFDHGTSPYSFQSTLRGDTETDVIRDSLVRSL